MSMLEAIGEALKLLFLTVQYVLDESKKHAQAVLDEKQKRALFDAAVARAQSDLRGEIALDVIAVDRSDDAADRDASTPLGTTEGGGVVKKTPVDKLGTVVDITSAKPRPDAEK